MFLALKEIRRAKVRFALVAGAVGLLVFLILFQTAILNSLISQFIGALKHQSAPVLVYNSQARKSLEGSVILAGQTDRIATVPGVDAAAPFGEGSFTVVANSKEQDAVIIGYQLAGPGEPTTLTAGRLPAAPFEAVASSRNSSDGFGLGSTIAVKPGDVTFTVVGLASEINFSVSPVLFTDFASYTQAKMAVNPDAKAILPSAIAVSISASSNATQVVAAINAAVPGVEALTRQQAVDGAPGVASVQQSFAIILLLFYLVVPLVTGLFFLIITFQKAGALTLLRAIGSPAGVLVRALLVQVVIVVLAGSAFATLLFVVSAGSATALGLTIEPNSIALTIAGVLALALLTSLAAVRRVLRIDPIAATTGAGGQLS